MRYPVLLAVLAATTLSTPAFAASDTPTVAVRFADLDLSTPEGQEQLERRIDTAARAACGMDEIRTGTRMPSNAVRKCFDQARTNVHEQVAELIARQKSRG